MSEQDWVSEVDKSIDGNHSVPKVLQGAIDTGAYENLSCKQLKCFSHIPHSLSPLLATLTGEDRNTGGGEQITSGQIVSTRLGESFRDFVPLTAPIEAPSKAASIAWTPQYHGKYREVVLNNINFMGRDGVYISSSAIIQNSATGKSRMVHPLPSFLFTIPFNLRDLRERKGMSFSSRFCIEVLAAATIVRVGLSTRRYEGLELRLQGIQCQERETWRGSCCFVLRTRIFTHHQGNQKKCSWYPSQRTDYLQL